MARTLRILQTIVTAAVVAGVLVLGTSYVFAAANTVPASRAGDGAGAISGYTITNVAYELNVGNPQNVDLVTFDVDVAPPVGAKMRLRLDSGGGAWYACTNAATAISCVTTAPQATVATSDELRFVVAQ